MKNIFAFCLLLPLLQSCNDGDLIVRNFDFEDAQLQTCNGATNIVFFKINPEVDESISLILTTTEELFIETGTQSFPLNEIDILVNYRSYNDEISASYFCNSIPPSTPLVSVQYIGTSGVARLISETTLDDNDGLVFVDSDDPQEEGFGDLDLDGIPNYYDFDDDGDNVSTAVEIGIDPENPRDSDEDGIFDYLDTDDDGDGILTIFEDNNQNLNPADDIDDVAVGPNYLNPDVRTATRIMQYRDHFYNRTSNADIILDNLVLINGEEEIILQTFNLGTINGFRNETITLTPEF